MAYTIVKSVMFEIKIKRSLFICNLLPVSSMEEAKEKIREISQQNQNASHNCWCYRLGIKGEIEHASDAGEPSGTAGKPMLGQLKKNEISNVAAIVTRYYGGVKLGVSGLIDAYGRVVSEALLLVKKLELADRKGYKIQTTYDFAEIIKYEVEKLGATEIQSIYGEYVLIEIEIRQEFSKPLEIYLNEIENSGKIKLLD